MRHVLETRRCLCGGKLERFDDPQLGEFVAHSVPLCAAWPNVSLVMGHISQCCCSACCTAWAAAAKSWEAAATTDGSLDSTDGSFVAFQSRDIFATATTIGVLMP